MKKLLILGLLMSMGFAWYGMDTEVATPTLTPDVPVAVEPVPDELFVYVTGAVKKPGLYAFKKEVHVSDAIHEAGDVAPYADTAAVNYAQTIHEGMHIHIPYNLEGIPAATEAGMININDADEKKMSELPGVGPATAKLIIEYRQANGPFMAIEDLKKIKGIGPAKFEKLKDKVTV